MSTVAIVDEIPFPKIFQNVFGFSLHASPFVLSSRYAVFHIFPYIVSVGYKWTYILVSV